MTATACIRRLSHEGEAFSASERANPVSCCGLLRHRSSQSNRPADLGDDGATLHVSRVCRYGIEVRSGLSRVAPRC
jgi:hypothetical protein